MARVFITGSSDGLGKIAAEMLIKDGHTVYLHARNEQRAKDAMDNLPRASGVCVGDLSKVEEVKALAKQVNDLGPMDAIIHNVGVYQTDSATIFAVNVLAPYVLTALIEMPKRLIYLSSGMHRGGSPVFKESQLSGLTYSDSKLQISAFAKFLSSKYLEVCSNSLDPGWVPTKMGGQNAPDDLDAGAQTQVWLASNPSTRAMVSGKYFKYMETQEPHPAVLDRGFQESLVSLCESISGVKLP